MDVKAEKKSQIQGIEATVRKKNEIGLCLFASLDARSVGEERKFCECEKKV